MSQASSPAVAATTPSPMRPTPAPPGAPAGTQPTFDAYGRPVRHPMPPPPGAHAPTTTGPGRGPGAVPPRPTPPRTGADADPPKATGHTALSRAVAEPVSLSPVFMRLAAGALAVVVVLVGFVVLVVAAIQGLSSVMHPALASLIVGVALVVLAVALFLYARTMGKTLQAWIDYQKKRPKAVLTGLIQSSPWRSLASAFAAGYALGNNPEEVKRVGKQAIKQARPLLGL